MRESSSDMRAFVTFMMTHPNVSVDICVRDAKGVEGMPEDGTAPKRSEGDCRSVSVAQSSPTRSLRAQRRGKGHALIRLIT